MSILSVSKLYVSAKTQEQVFNSWKNDTSETHQVYRRFIPIPFLVGHILLWAHCKLASLSVEWIHREVHLANDLGIRHGCQLELTRSDIVLQTAVSHCQRLFLVGQKPFLKNMLKHNLQILPWSSYQHYGVPHIELRQPKIIIIPPHHLVSWASSVSSLISSNMSLIFPLQSDPKN